MHKLYLKTLNMNGIDFIEIRSNFVKHIETSIAKQRMLWLRKP